MTPAELRARTKRAVQAAVAAARELGLDVGEPVVLHDVFSVVVHLAPLPVVVRVPVVLPQPLRGAALVARQQREIDVVRWLARRGVAVVAPSSLVPANPIQRDGYSMTFWELAEASEEHVPYGPGDSGRVVKLHAVLRDYPAEGLAFLSPVNAVVPALLESLAATPELISASDLDRARREWEVLEPVLGSREGFEALFPETPVQAVHGDAPSYNIILTLSGPRFADFEDVTCGPVEWDLAGGIPEDVENYNREARRLGLRPLDPAVLRVMTTARMLQLVAAFALVPELPVLAEGLRPALEAWRAMPLAGGIG